MHESNRDKERKILLCENLSFGNDGYVYMLIDGKKNSKKRKEFLL